MPSYKLICYWVFLRKNSACLFSRVPKSKRSLQVEPPILNSLCANLLFKLTHCATGRRIVRTYLTVRARSCNNTRSQEHFAFLLQAFNPPMSRSVFCCIKRVRSTKRLSLLSASRYIPMHSLTEFRPDYFSPFLFCALFELNRSENSSDNTRWDSKFWKN